MELLSINRYWRRRQYRRLHGGGGRGRKKIQVTRFHGGPAAPARARRWIRLRAPRRALRVIGLGVISPLKLWSKLKNVYIHMMLSLAGNVGYLNTNNVFGSKRIPKSRPVPVPVAYSGSEVEQRLIVEIYKALQIVSAQGSHEVKPVL